MSNSIFTKIRNVIPNSIAKNLAYQPTMNIKIHPHEIYMKIQDQYEANIIYEPDGTLYKHRWSSERDYDYYDCYKFDQWVVGNVYKVTEDRIWLGNTKLMKQDLLILIDFDHCLCLPKGTVQLFPKRDAINVWCKQISNEEGRPI